MKTRRILQLILVFALAAGVLLSTGTARADPGCPSQLTVELGDTLNSLAAFCGTTPAAIVAANPGLVWQLQVGQVLYIPSGSSAAVAPNQITLCSNTYVAAAGDTLGGVAMLFGLRYSDLLRANPQLGSGRSLHAGQVVNLPGPANCSSNTYPSGTYPSPTPVPINYCAQTFPSGTGNLKVTYGKGLRVRTGPGLSNSEIVSPFVGALQDTIWRYRRNSITVDSVGLVWVEVALNQMVDGRCTGWIMVSDVLGGFYTSPELGPYVKHKHAPRDP